MKNPFSALERQTESLEQAERHWRQRHQQSTAGGKPAIARPLTIALTREAGTPGTSVAHVVGERLGWPVYDHELVERVANEMGLRARLLASVDERQKSWLLEMAEGFASTKSVTESGYVRHLVDTILSLGTHGHCVIVGRGAAQILPDDSTLRVRLVGRLEDRIAAAARRFNLPHDQAVRWVEDTDRQRVQFVKDHFYKDPADPHRYDLLLNTSRWSEAECADFIVQAVQRVEGPAAGQQGKG